MKKINSDKINFEVHKDSILYIFELKGKYINLKKIDNSVDDKKIEIINLSHDSILFKRMYRNKFYNLNSDIEKDKLVNEILENLSDSYILKETIDLNYLINSIKKHYINIIIDNGDIALSLNNDKLSIVLLSTNTIIGEIIIDYDVRVKVDKKYLNDSLNLLSQYVLLDNKNQKKLVKNS